MINIRPFIALDWHTVPLKGKLERLEDGSKTLPSFQKNWKDYYKKNKNTTESKLGGVLTGKLSNVIAIDCDNPVTYELFKSLDTTYSFEFMSEGKKSKTGESYVCGTLLYLYDDEFADSFSINDGTVALDFYSNEGFVYLPTDSNTTKQPWSGKLPTLKPLPQATRVLLQTFKATKKPTQAKEYVGTNIMTASCLAPLVQQFTQDRKFLPGLFKIITPKSFRQEEQYIKEGYLHPANIPQGRGSEYLTKMSAILGKDISINDQLYASAMHDINALWADPMDEDRLDSTIIDPMLDGKSSIDGVQIWQYDENWSKYRFILHTKRQSSLELGFDDMRDAYYCVDVANEHPKQFTEFNKFASYICSVAVNPPKKAVIQMSLPIINVKSQPDKSFGFHAGSDPTARTLNTFIRTPELAILEDPTDYAKLYKKPTTTLQFLTTLVPEEEMRTFLLQFIRRKLRTFEYSPVMLYFLGVPGSGKDTFVQVLEKIMGHVTRPTTKEFLELYNSWMLDSYFVQLDEYGNQLTTMRDKEEALGKLKAYTGKQNIQIRQMRTDGFMYKHNATFIATANSNPFGIEDGDRRIALFATPNVLIDQPWVDDIVSVHRKILSETKDFCYYLATEVADLPGAQYMKPPESAHKQELIADSMYAAQRIAYVLKNGMMDYLKNLAHDYGSKEVLKAIAKGRLRATDLEELYEIMTDYKGEMRSLNKAIRSSGVEIKATTQGGRKDYYYNLDCLEYNDSPFDGDEDENTDI